MQSGYIDLPERQTAFPLMLSCSYVDWMQLTWQQPTSIADNNNKTQGRHFLFIAALQPPPPPPPDIHIIQYYHIYTYIGWLQECSVAYTHTYMCVYKDNGYENSPYIAESLIYRRINQPQEYLSACVGHVLASFSR